MEKFTKIALGPDELLEKLEAQGMCFPDRSLALLYIKYVGAFRLKAYWFGLQNSASKNFPSGTSFDRIIAAYEFDRHIRAKAFFAIDRLEIAIRTTISNQLAIKHGAHWYLDSKIFKPTDKWSYGSMIKKIEEEVGRAKGRAYISAYNRKYDDPYIAQSWAITECVTFGFWSKTYGILRDPNDKKAISNKFGIDKWEVFASWIHSLNYFRNLIAHHERLTKITLAIAPISYKAGSISFANNNKKVYTIATVINFLSRETGLSSSWKEDLSNAFLEFSDIKPTDLGFPPDWQDRPEWNVGMPDFSGR